MDSALTINFSNGSTMTFYMEKPVGNVGYYRVELDVIVQDHDEAQKRTTSLQKCTWYVIAPAKFSILRWTSRRYCPFEDNCGITNHFEIVSIQKYDS